MNIKLHIYGLLGAAAIVAGASSCTDLDEKTFDRIDASVYYQDAKSVQGAVARIYTSAMDGMAEFFHFLNELPADQVAWRTWNGGAWGWDEAEKFVLSSQTWNSESKIVKDAWEHAWETIGLCNNVIHDLEALDASKLGMKEEELKVYIAQVRTMRAWCYYNNFELWGGALPLNTAAGGTVPGSIDTDFNVGCQKMWQFIADELDACYEDLHMEDGSNLTRTELNMGMNRMLKMRLLLNSELWTGTDRYDECATLAQEIIDGKYGQYNLVTDYRDIYAANNNTCPEVVFAFAMDPGHYNYQIANNRVTPMLPLAYGPIFDFECDMTGWNCCCVVPSKDNSGTLVPYAGSTGSKSFIFDYGDKLGAPFDRMNEKDIRRQPYTVDAAGNWQGLFLMGNQVDYVTGDPIAADADLQDKPLIFVDQVGTFQNLGRDLETVMSPRWGETNSGYRLMRYPFYPSTAGKDYREADEVQFRLAEVYYTLAECRLRKGNVNGAKELVNNVRQRYFNAADMAELEKPGPGFTAFDLDWMLSEWGLEYLDEGRRRRTDLRRFDKFTQGQWWFFGRATEADRELPAKRDRKYEWYPLPATALMVNPGLVQNPNY